MKRVVLVGLLVLAVGGCLSDVTVTREFMALDYKCVYVGEIKSDDPHVSEILQDCLEK